MGCIGRDIGQRVFVDNRGQLGLDGGCVQRVKTELHDRVPSIQGERQPLRARYIGPADRTLKTLRTTSSGAIRYVLEGIHTTSTLHPFSLHLPFLQFTTDALFLRRRDACST